MIKMKRSFNSLVARSMMLAILSSLVIASHAEDLNGFQVGGHLDLYYQYDFGKPGTGSTVGLRNFDVTHNQFSFAVLQLNVSKAPTKETPIGFTAQFVTGKNADIMSALEPAGTETYRLIQQAYITYALPKGATLDFGKFLTPVGYESPISYLNDNYSISFLFTLGQPTYHFGLRYTDPISKDLTVMGHVVNGWNEVDDSNAGKMVGAAVTYTGLKDTSVTLDYMGGQEGSSSVSGIGFPVPGTASVNIGDLNATYNLSSHIKLAVDGTYADATAIDTGDPSGKWSGIAGYLKFTASDKCSGTLRYESFSDPQGLRSGKNSHLNSLTATAEYKTTSTGLLRVELRQDYSNRDSFADRDGFSGKRTTLTVAHIFRF